MAATTSSSDAGEMSESTIEPGGPKRHPQDERVALMHAVLTGVEHWVDSETSWEQTAPRHVEQADWRRFERSIAEIFTAFGMNLDTAGTEETPTRFLRALYDATAGHEGDHTLLTTFPTECRCDSDCLVSQIIEGPIPFSAVCEHHSLPFHGFAHVGYVAHEQIIGISKLTRLVRLFARRFTMQERLGEQIADALEELLEPHGVAVHIDAVHLCTQLRGVSEDHSKMVTKVWRGGYGENPELRREFLAETRNGNPWS